MFFNIVEIIIMSVASLLMNFINFVIYGMVAIGIMKVSIKWNVSNFMIYD